MVESRPTMAKYSSLLCLYFPWLCYSQFLPISHSNWLDIQKNRLFFDTFFCFFVVCCLFTILIVWLCCLKVVYLWQMWSDHLSSPPPQPPAPEVITYFEHINLRYMTYSRVSFDCFTSLFKRNRFRHSKNGNANRLLVWMFPKNRYRNSTIIWQSFCKTNLLDKAFLW
jgi:hypothetical protein